MTKAGSFDEWMADTEELIVLIQHIGRDVWNIREFKSPQFSFSRNTSNDLFTYEYNRELTPQEEIASISGPAIAQSMGVSMSSIGSPISAPTGFPGNHAHGMSSNTITYPGINNVIITVYDFHIKSVKWIRKPNSVSTIYFTPNNSNFGQQDGGMVRSSMLFSKGNNIIVDGKIYSPDTPDAFNQDIVTENASIRFLDLLHFREKYNGRLFE